MEKEENYFSMHQEIASTIEPMPISNIEFTINGENLAYTTNEMLKIYSTSTGTLRNVISASIDTMKFFQNNTLLHSKDKSIFYLSIYDNKYLRKFEGHTLPIKNISVDSTKDMFMSIGDDCVNLWDFKMKNPIKRLNTSRHIGCIGSENRYFLCDNNYIKIFDLRSDNGPLITKQIEPSFYKKAWYTNDCNFIVISSLRSYSFLNDEGDFLSYISLENESDGCTTMQSDNLLCGSKRMVFAYRISDRTRIGTLETQNGDNLVIRSNPCSEQFVAASENVIRFYSPSN